MRRLLLSACFAALTCTPALAGALDAAGAPPLFPDHSRVWSHVTFQAPSEAGEVEAAGQAAPRPRVAAVEYSDAYRQRAKIHRYSSFAMLPLVGTELLLGQSIYNTPNAGRRSAHIAVGTGIGVLFGVNTVTGAWNLWEARKDPNGRGRRIAHALLMMGADVGFLATAATGPSREHERERFGGTEGSPATHRAIAITSLATATAGYLVMLLGGR